jgi:hypothetical protein
MVGDTDGEDRDLDGRGNVVRGSPFPGSRMELGRRVERSGLLHSARVGGGRAVVIHDRCTGAVVFRCVERTGRLSSGDLAGRGELGRDVEVHLGHLVAGGSMVRRSERTGFMDAGRGLERIRENNGELDHRGGMERNY